MSDQLEDRAKVVEDVFTIALEPNERRELLALLWDWNAEDWKRGVMYGGGPGTIPPVTLDPNPYRHPPHTCNAPLNIKGEGFNCDKGWGHALPHGNTEAGAIWDGEQPPSDSPEPTR